MVEISCCMISTSRRSLQKLINVHSIIVWYTKAEIQVSASQVMESVLYGVTLKPDTASNGIRSLRQTMNQQSLLPLDIFQIFKSLFPPTAIEPGCSRVPTDFQPVPELSDGKDGSDVITLISSVLAFILALLCN